MSQFLQSFGLLVARLGTGGILLLHGITHWTGANQGVAAMRDRFAAVGAPYADVAAWATVIFELVGGVFLIVGAFTRFVGVGLVVLSVLTISYFSYYRGPDLVKADGTLNGGYEYDVALGLLGLLFFVFGAGAVSIDRLFKRKKPVEDTEDDPAYLPAGTSSTSSSGYGSTTTRSGSQSVT